MGQDELVGQVREGAEKVMRASPAYRLAEWGNKAAQKARDLQSQLKARYKRGSKR